MQPGQDRLPEKGEGGPALSLEGREGLREAEAGGTAFQAENTGSGISK